MATYNSKAHPLPYDPIITSFSTKDVRFPTSLDKTGSDAMNAAGDYSAAYCLLHTSSSPGASGEADRSTKASRNPTPVGHGMTFTIGRGNEIVCTAMPYFAAQLVDMPLSQVVGNFGATWRKLVSDSQVRWVGPEKGVTQLALGAVVNAIWDLWAKVVNKPVWRLVAEMEPEELVSCLNWKYCEDVLGPSTGPEAGVEVLRILREAVLGKDERMKEAYANKAVPAYTTSAGWLGYGKEKMQRLLQETMDSGYRHFKLKVGGNIEQDRERLAIAREVIGYDKENVLMVDANQVWDVPQAIEYMKHLAEFKPWFIEEPTSPDDILGHAEIRRQLKPLGIGVATGEMCQNRMMFKQLMLAGAIDVCQVDACRMGGLNEVLVVLLMAKKLGAPIVPHSGGVGLPEYTQRKSVRTCDRVSANAARREHNRLRGRLREEEHSRVRRLLARALLPPIEHCRRLLCHSLRARLQCGDEARKPRQVCIPWRAWSKLVAIGRGQSNTGAERGVEEQSLEQDEIVQGRSVISLI